MSHGAPPVIPTDLLPYESYTEDPKWQTRFTIMWCAALALAVVLAAPQAFSPRNLKASAAGLLGVRVRGAYEGLLQDDKQREGAPIPQRAETPTRASALTTAARVLGSFRLWSLPGITLNVGQMFVVAGYAVFALVCIVLQAPLVENSNRAGFLALAQLPPVFLFASKNSPLTALLLGPGVDYTKLNYIHRWSARFLILGAIVHGSLWINNHIIWDLPILSQQKEASGVAALGCLCVIALSSVAVVRRRVYSAFLVLHFLLFPAFFVTICYHTIYAPPWIFPPLAFYGADLLVRIFRWRVVVGRVEAKDGGISLIHVPAATSGWRAGQHVQVRALIGGRAWEAHPLSVCCAPAGEGCLSGPDGEPLGMLLAARACGDWSRALHNFALTPEPQDYYFDDDEDLPVEKDCAAVEAEAAHEKPAPAATTTEKAALGRDAHLILDGPYGGPTLHAPDYARVLLFAGGSGATFTLGVLDELVGRCTRPGAMDGTRTRKVVWCWCVRSFGAINWFAPYLLQIATRAAAPGSPIQLTIRIFVTCLCDPDAVPAIPGCTVTEARPQVEGVLKELLGAAPAAGARAGSSEVSSASASAEDLPKGKAADVEAGVDDAVEGGGVAVVVAGPGGLIREASNAAARANLSARGRRAGGVAFCAEAFTV
ncbi:iron reductase [Mycena latifolia]|nr:iron reductase [Mycena latifolia]